ncbi:MAG: CRISPR-associated endonuclease Cas2 [Candidatus Edwardsbacteria bacterium RIFOXYD12_FULL_50_11]|uniref:CRISPR-associated endoribonuclease Cas2 n=1 Tax=Candidatus Edwardsbacteria bacterium GWF2_54_11 TaxID=1817851 RepID=A0A1F5RF78_9BACT|nr:MAG: CRISPR-associated endonuclease Cas2 [Candidatus Edwardsbacteria bacterium RifOxyC12_full_54_24]OGF07900.1 MAG: CRISPR-associated endonuclease Cas2 [Candidatus Edwardsbacteria bacterium RifOxyA12_full_54_48]OGF10148.1 MAG: CRISPR-associated endonuclease Cas2 [Candidatus Edwardsbacteria bacterium GWE2_54_12]OGF13090.1 MAG: CRISPR-associated endonuclease Cas2 [Candidatus Edwardsbacteria bacterium GWF2_54_11]OGF15060.1 MAG: CRISPR-associated endonuclease Cas2 [Candidatus Edwardsbacteria bac
MMVLVSYDVCTKTLEGRRRLRQVAKACKDYGTRVQNSVFECNVDPSQWTALKNRLLKIFQPDMDSLRFYFLGSNYKRRIEHLGAKPAVDVEEPQIV